jgi:hypothetical protein
MFTLILYVVLNAGTAQASPVVIAGFRTQSTCELVKAVVVARGPLFYREVHRS